MLQNPGLEKDWAVEASHNVLICELGKPPRASQVGNIHTPPGWLVWYQHDDDYAQPEVRDAWKSGDPRRVRSGEKGILFFTFYKRHRGGFLQQVDVEPGQRLRFTAYMHAWSNNKDPNNPDIFPHPDDGRWSEGAGYQEVAWKMGTQPSDTGDPQKDAKPNFLFMVGIDPTGGCDPLADTVIWGDAYHIYNGYCQQLSVEATAQGDKVTVFTYSGVLWPFKHCDSYLDDAELVVISDEPPSPPGRGQPRVQYPRSYVLLPPDADMEWANAVVDSTWGNYRYTIGGSADDSAIGNLDERNIIAVNPGEWPDDLLAFYDEYYPGVNVTTIEAATPAILKRILNDDHTDIVCHQRDARWANLDLGELPGGETIGQAGCYLCGLVMCLRHAGHWCYPPEINKVLADSGEPFIDDDMLVDWAAAVGLFPKIFNESKKVNTQYTAAELRALLETNWEVILRRADGKHFVYLEGVEGNALRIIDPWDGQRKVWTSSMAQGVRAARRGQTPEPPPPCSGTLIGLHLQTMVPGALDYVRAAKPKVMKVFQLENARAIKTASPNTLVVLRYYTPDQNMSGDLAQRAREYVATFEDSLRTNAHWIDYVESYNETIPSGNPEVIKRSVEFDCHFADALMALELPVKPMLLNVPVGNPFESEIELLLPAVHKVIEYGSCIGYHGYGLAVAPDGDLNDNWQHYAGRALESWDPVFRSHGLYPDYFLGEAGAFATCGDGWRSSKCLNGNWPRYLEQLKGFQSRLQAWNVTHGYRCLGAVLFSSGAAYMGWENFQITQSEMISMAIEL